jgi:hypothetical protein
MLKQQQRPATSCKVTMTRQVEQHSELPGRHKHHLRTSTALLLLLLLPWLLPSGPSSSGAGCRSAGCKLCSSEKRASATRAYVTRCGQPMSAPLAWHLLSRRASSTILTWRQLPGPGGSGRGGISRDQQEEECRSCAQTCGHSVGWQGFALVLHSN